MNYDLYQNKVSYPTRPKTPVAPSIEAPMKEHEEYLIEVEYYKKKQGEYETQVKAYREEEKACEERFKADLFEDLGLVVFGKKHPKADTLYWMAWDRGHSSGFSSVYEEARELVELLIYTEEELVKLGEFENV